MMEGVVNVLKPPGMTSSDVVSDIRKLFGTRRVGHAGTLDPGAAGVLPVCIGRATRLFDYLVDKQKEYIAELCVGVQTDTQDSYGEAIATSDKRITQEELIAVLPEFTGEQMQTVPMYSAVRSNGKKLYQLAREGKEVERAGRSITVGELEYLGCTGPDRFLLRILCSKGTYVRTLCVDVGERLGACAHLSFLLRTRSGNFSVEHAFSIAELNERREAGRLEETLVPMDQAVSHLPELRLSLNERNERLLINGAGIRLAERAATPHRIYANGRFIGIGLDGPFGLHIDTFLMEEPAHV